MNTISKKTVFIVLIAGMQMWASAQKKEVFMHSTIAGIKIYTDNKPSDWRITPSAHPDVFRIYDPNVKKKTVKFVSDIDSVEFKVNVNKPVYFSVLYKGDTAYTCIDFTNALPNKLSKADKLMALSLFWSETRYNFAFYDQLTFDWDSLYKVYLPLVEATTNDVDFYDIMQHFAGSLQDGHSSIFSDVYYQYGDYIPMLVDYFNDTLYITRVRDDLENACPLGSKILEINGLPFDQYMDKYINPFVDSKYKPTQQVLAALRLFSSRPLQDKITIKYITPNREIRTITPPRDGEKNRDKHSSKSRETNYNYDPIYVSWQEDNIAVLTINSFLDWDGKQIAYFEKKLRDTLYNADGIIIDLRNNGGGSTDVAWYFLQYIIKDSFFLNYAWQTRIHNAVKKANGNFIEENKAYYEMNAYQTFAGDTIFIGDSIQRFSVPIVILISTMTVSAAEDFLVILYERKDRPLLIGQPSFGSTGSPLVFREWPDPNGLAKVCTRRVLFPYSLKPLDKGVEPDIWVNYTFEEYMSGKDKDMEIAIQELKKQLKEQK
jgi:hypothetical protein